MAKKSVLPVALKNGMIVVMCAVAVVGSAFYLTSNKSKTVYRVATSPAYTATFYNEKCDSEAVLARIPPEQITSLGDRLKSGTVTLNNPEGQVTHAFCYVVVDKTDTFEAIAVLDETGAGGTMLLPVQKEENSKKVDKNRI